MQNKLRVKKGDKVIVIAGKDKGKQGEIIEVFPAKRRVRVSGVNVAKKHQRTGGIVDIERSLDVSNVALADPKTGKAARVGFKVLEDGKKVRYSKKTGEVIDN